MSERERMKAKRAKARRQRVEKAIVDACQGAVAAGRVPAMLTLTLPPDSDPALPEQRKMFHAIVRLLRYHGVTDWGLGIHHPHNRAGDPHRHDIHVIIDLEPALAERLEAITGNTTDAEIWNRSRAKLTGRWDSLQAYAETAGYGRRVSLQSVYDPQRLSEYLLDGNQWAGMRAWRSGTIPSPGGGSQGHIEAYMDAAMHLSI